MSFRRLTPLSTYEAFRDYLDSSGIDLPVDAAVDPSGPLSEPVDVAGHIVGNRFAALPMEGWDCAADGNPGDLTRRRWERIGAGGSKLIWGGEAAAVREDGRSSGHQLLVAEHTVDGIADLRSRLVSAHAAACGTTDDLLVGLQLTHSGRFSRPHDEAAPVAAYHHPLLDERFPDDVRVLSDDEIDELVDDFVVAAVRAELAGFQFVDVKHCHGYFTHELLSARRRDGRYGGSLENRTRFLRSVVAGVRERTDLAIGVRLSLADVRPFHAGEGGVGEPVDAPQPYWPAFGSSDDGLDFDLTETHELLSVIESLGIELLCATVGSPYYNPHVQRPAAFPPSDGYLPPEDPLQGVARHLRVAREVKEQHPSLEVVGSGYSYLQQWLPNVAQAVVAAGHADFVGLGRMLLSYPDMPRDVLAGRPLASKRICRTFSDCTTAPRHGLVSGCYPLDSVYKQSDEGARVRLIKKELKGRK
jgi:2,4-dienoyl-CoA reductase-like NADH-dependent reductase (Old Yellow Enzyme family)